MFIRYNAIKNISACNTSIILSLAWYQRSVKYQIKTCSAFRVITFASFLIYCSLDWFCKIIIFQFKLIFSQHVLLVYWKSADAWNMDKTDILWRGKMCHWKNLWVLYFTDLIQSGFFGCSDFDWLIWRVKKMAFLSCSRIKLIHLLTYLFCDFNNLELSSIALRRSYPDWADCLSVYVVVSWPFSQIVSCD